MPGSEWCSHACDKYTPTPGRASYENYTATSSIPRAGPWRRLPPARALAATDRTPEMAAEPRVTARPATGRAGIHAEGARWSSLRNCYRPRQHRVRLIPMCRRGDPRFCSPSRQCTSAGRRQRAVPPCALERRAPICGFPSLFCSSFRPFISVDGPPVGALPSRPRNSDGPISSRRRCRHCRSR